MRRTAALLDAFEARPWQPGRPRLVAFGHSWVAGRYPERWVQPWPQRAAARLGMSVRNAGEGSSESPDVARRVLKYAPRRGDVVAIEAALNDLRRFGEDGLARYRASLHRMLLHLASSGAPTTVLLVLDPPITTWTGHAGFDRGSLAGVLAYAEVSREVARDHGALPVDLAAGWQLAIHVASDGVHPSAAGVRHISDAVVAVISAVDARHGPSKVSERRSRATRSGLGRRLRP